MKLSGVLFVKMDLLLIICYILIGNVELSSPNKAVTLDINSRIVLLKQSIKDQYKSIELPDNTPIENSLINENVEYIDLSNEPVTPISEHDPRKRKQLYKMKEIKTTRDLGQNFKQDAKTPERKKHRALERNATRFKRTKKRGQSRMLKKSKITDVFYRRFSSEAAKQWTHCQDLITPFLIGHKTNITTTKVYTQNSTVVVRLVELLTEDVSDLTKEDITSILYQISNLQLRLFQWDMPAMKLLLTSIISVTDAAPQEVSFKAIKQGLKSIFNSWNLHFGADITLLLKQARIFRPPCVKITHNEGSTMSSKTIRYTKSVKPKCNRRKGYHDCED